MAKEYTNGELTIKWEASKCIHAAECVKALPNVYRPQEKPWITIENASTEELKAQIQKCPSGALSYYLNDLGKKDQVESQPEGTKVDVLANGPLLVHGNLSVKNSAGETETKSKTTAFCRCGHSQLKPYCDGAHNKSGFVG